jgi:uncharacterized small protein (DUF1192 family)
MAPAQKDLLTRLAEAGESAVKALGEAPGADRFIGAANALRERLDELQKRVRGLEELERRIASLERKVERLAKESATGSKGKPAASSKKAD